MSTTPVDQYLSRITVVPDVRSGQPSIRGTRGAVKDVLVWLAAGATEDQILSDYPYLEKDDFKAVYAYTSLLLDQTAR